MGSLWPGFAHQRKELELAGDVVRLPGRGIVMKEERKSKSVIERAFARRG